MALDITGYKSNLYSRIIPADATDVQVTFMKNFIDAICEETDKYIREGDVHSTVTVTTTGTAAAQAGGGTGEGSVN